MKKIFGVTLLGLALGTSSLIFAQEGQNQPPREGKNRMERQGKRGNGPGFRGMRGGRGEMRGNPMIARGMRGGGFGISDAEIYKLNLTDAQKLSCLILERKWLMKERASVKTLLRVKEPNRLIMSIVKKCVN